MKTLKRFVAFSLTFSSIVYSTAAPTFASESYQGRTAASTELHSFLVSGLAAAEAVSEFENTTQAKTLIDGLKYFDLTRNVFSTALAELLNGFDTGSTAIDVYKDLKWLIDQITSEFVKDPNVSLDALFQQYMTDDTILLNYGNVEKEALIQNSMAVVCSYILGGYAGVADTALGILKSTMIGFTIETYTDFFNYVAWLSLQYGYSGRYAIRFSDYAGI